MLYTGIGLVRDGVRWSSPAFKLRLLYLQHLHYAFHLFVTLCILLKSVSAVQLDSTFLALTRTLPPTSITPTPCSLFVNLSLFQKCTTSRSAIKLFPMRYFCLHQTSIIVYNIYIQYF